MKVIPIINQIFVRLAKRKKKTDTGIYLPDAGKEVLWGGRVIVVNPDEKIIEPGDEIFFNRYSDKKLVLDNEEISVVKNKDLIAILREGKLIAPRDMTIVKVHYDEKIGAIVIPEYKGVKQYNSGFYGEVHAVGPDYPYDIKEGDHIYFRRHEGKAFTYKDENYMSLKEKWVDGLFLKAEEVRRKND